MTNNWIYQGHEITDISQTPKDSVGFCYKITNLQDGRYYVGRKILYNNKRTVISKRIKKATGTRKKYNSVTVESDWASYFGSCAELHSDRKVIQDQYWKREILEFCYSKRQLNYKETWWQFKLNVLEEYTYNGSILGRYYKDRLI